MSNKYLCIHGHFYQPPRENPWLESVEVQFGAAPYHDWNVLIEIVGKTTGVSVIRPEGLLNVQKERASLPAER